MFPHGLIKHGTWTVAASVEIRLGQNYEPVWLKANHLYQS